MMTLFWIGWFISGFIAGCVYFHDIQDIGDARFKKDTYYSSVLGFLLFFTAGFFSLATALVVIVQTLHNSGTVGFLIPFSRKSKEAAGMV